uniref:Uncharacterized protein n=1 Tax=Phenylobacterium glaciei TaxID=2803784 RepID=A0A974P4U2_9CAUL|nr:hypothetical protein JKL49_07110 [Phenylobacterium glaciei]
MEAAEACLVQATAFVREKNIVTVPNDPVKIGLVPEFQRGVAVAYCDAPGPLDKGQQTYYKISPSPTTGPTPRPTASCANTTAWVSRRSPSTRPCPATTCSWPTPTPTLGAARGAVVRFLRRGLGLLCRGRHGRRGLPDRDPSTCWST